MPGSSSPPTAKPLRPLCVIPARAGSKRFAFKNTATLSGRPLLAYTIEAALASGIFDNVFVSTESANIAKAAASAGANVPFMRPKDLAGDDVTNVAVSLHWYDAMLERGDVHDAIVCLQPSSPLRGADDIGAAWDRFVEQKRDFLVSVTSIDPHDFHWAMEEKNGVWGMFFEDRFLDVRQNLPQLFRPNGAIKIACPEALRAAGSFFGENLGVLEMPAKKSVHVATDYDLLLCETILRTDRGETI